MLTMRFFSVLLPPGGGMTSGEEVTIGLAKDGAPQKRFYVLHLPPRISRFEKNQFHLVEPSEEDEEEDGLFNTEEAEAEEGEEEEQEDEEEQNRSLKDKEQVGLLWFLHGEEGGAWYSALSFSRWIHLADQVGMLVVFPQALAPGTTHQYPKVGEFEEEEETATWNFTTPEEDLHYMACIWQELLSRYWIDPTKTFVVGHGSGGLFSSLVACHFGSNLTAICNHMGGLLVHLPEQQNEQQNEQQETAFVVCNDKQKSCYLWIITGSEDPMLPYCVEAQKAFEKAGWPVRFSLLEGMAHDYLSGMIEPPVWEWFLSCSAALQRRVAAAAAASSLKFCPPSSTSSSSEQHHQQREQPEPDQRQGKRRTQPPQQKEVAAAVATGGGEPDGRAEDAATPSAPLLR
ncbi:hypothetical protein QOT17_002495 [Balamuthia mandrillaris]